MSENGKQLSNKQLSNDSCLPSASNEQVRARSRRRVWPARLVWPLFRLPLPTNVESAGACADVQSVRVELLGVHAQMHRSQS